MPKYVMSDGRAFTSYLPSCELNRLIQKKYNLTNSHQYRYFLQRSGETIVKEISALSDDNPCVFCPVCKQALEYKPQGQ